MEYAQARRSDVCFKSMERLADNRRLRMNSFGGGEVDEEGFSLERRR